MDELELRDQRNGDSSNVIWSVTRSRERKHNGGQYSGVSECESEEGATVGRFCGTEVLSGEDRI